MEITRINFIRILFVTIFFLSIIIPGIKFYYFDIYLMSLNGRVEAIRTDIKELMYITVSKEEHDLADSWPNLQRNIEVGDSVFKKPKEYDIILVKKKTGQKFKCLYDE